MRYLYHTLFFLCSLWISTTTVSALDFVKPTLTNEGKLAPPSSSPIRIEGFKFSYETQQTNGEATVQMRWERVRFAEEYRVYRRKSSFLKDSSQYGLTAFILPDNLAPLGGWSLIRASKVGSWFVDKDIPPLVTSVPPSARRPLGMLYCYRIEATSNGKEFRSPVICTSQRGINAPLVKRENVKAISPSEISLIWEDFSEMELGFKINFKADGGTSQTVTLLGPDRERFVINGLLPDTEYCVQIQSFDFYGTSPGSRYCTKTERLQDAEPADSAFTVKLQRLAIYQGNIPYEGRFPTNGLLPSGILKEVRSANGFPPLRFVKPGHNTGECNQADAVVLLNPGGKLSPENLETLFGSKTPALPIYFLACAGQSQQLHDWIPINITYQKD